MVVEIYDCLAGIESKKETGLRIRESSKKKNRRLMIFALSKAVKQRVAPSDETVL